MCARVSVHVLVPYWGPGVSKREGLSSFLTLWGHLVGPNKENCFNKKQKLQRLVSNRQKERKKEMFWVDLGGHSSN